MDGHRIDRRSHLLHPVGRLEFRYSHVGDLLAGQESVSRWEDFVSFALLFRLVVFILLTKTLVHWHLQGIEDSFLRKVVDGYRMDQPKYAPANIYELMKRCWHADPDRRPNFSEIKDILSPHINAAVLQRFADMKELHSDAGNQAVQSLDYLSMMGSVTSAQGVLPPLADENNHYQNRYGILFDFNQLSR